MIFTLKLRPDSLLSLALLMSPALAFLDKWDFGSKTKFQFSRSNGLSAGKHQHLALTTQSSPVPTVPTQQSKAVIDQIEEMDDGETLEEVTESDTITSNLAREDFQPSQASTQAPNIYTTTDPPASKAASDLDLAGGVNVEISTEITTEVTANSSSSSESAVELSGIETSNEDVAKNTVNVPSKFIDGIQFNNNSQDEEIESTTSAPVGSGIQAIESLIVEEEPHSALLPAGFREKRKLKAKIANKYRDLKSKNGEITQEDYVKSPDSQNLNTVGIESFGKITTTTVDPIAELLSSVQILDVKSYIPIGYKFVKDDNEAEEEIAVNPQGNINDLLFDDDLRKKKLRRKSKQLNNLDNEVFEEVSSKPGKLNGRLLARISKEMKEKSAEEDLYIATFGGSKQKFGWRDQEESEVDNSKEEKPVEFDPSSLFESLLGNGGPKVQSTKPKLSKPLTSPPRSSTASPTTTSYRTSTLGVCGQFCGLSGSLRILSGLDWREELLHDFTDEFRENKKNLERLMTEKFSQVYFGNALEFCSVDAFSRLDDAVVAEFYLQFSGIVFNVTSADVTRSWVELLDVEDGQYKLGRYVVDVNTSRFQVVDTEILNDAENLVFAKYGVELPDWAWLVVMAGIVSTFIVALLGVVFGVQKYRLSRRVNKRVLNAKTLEALRNNNSFDMLEIDHSKAYEKDKRDLWTLQRAIQNESRLMKLPRVNSQDSGRGSGSSYTGPFNGVFQRFPSLRGRPSNGVSVNDSQAGLLNSYDNTGYNDDCDLDTSYENNDSDSDQQEKAEISRQQLVEDLGEEDSEDAVSDGPSERF